MVKTPIFKGSCTAIVTPFDEHGINFEKIKELIDFQYDNGTAAIVVCGTTGENATMTRYEHEALIEFVCRYNEGRMKIIAGVGSNDTKKALGFAQCAMRCDADGILMVTPYYNKTTQKGLVEHFTYVADRVDIPMIVYNVPSRTSIGIKADTYKKLSEHPNINGVKEASGNISHVMKLHALCGDDLNIWSGNDDQIPAVMACGGKGVISVLSNICPQETHNMVQAYLDGDANKCTEMMAKYLELANAMFVEVNPIPVKAACNMMGWAAGPCKMPLCEMTDEHTEYVKSVMQKYGLIK